MSTDEASGALSHPSSSPFRMLEDCWNKIGVWGDGSCPEMERIVHCRECSVFTTAAARLLDRDLSPQDQSRWTKQIAADRTTLDPGTTSVLIFRIGKEWLALPTHVFQEVAEQTTLHSVPHHREGLLSGLVCIRGELLLCASLEKLLGIERQPHEGPSHTANVYRRLLVVSGGEGPFAFAVDEVQGVSSYKPKELHPLPATIPETSAHYLLGILSSKGKSVGCLHDELLFHAVNRGWV